MNVSSDAERVEANKGKLRSRGWELVDLEYRPWVGIVIHGSLGVSVDERPSERGRWDDHGALYYRKADGEYMYVSEPYHIELHTLKELVALCDQYGLDLWIHPAAVWNPDVCTAIWIVRRGVSFLKADTE